jgi:hypothetical protein
MLRSLNRFLKRILVKNWLILLHTTESEASLIRAQEPTVISVLSHMNPLCLYSVPFKIHFNIIIQDTPKY